MELYMMTDRVHILVIIPLKYIESSDMKYIKVKITDDF
jgi:hypothetical protein